MHFLKKKDLNGDKKFLFKLFKFTKGIFLLAKQIRFCDKRQAEAGFHTFFQKETFVKGGGSSTFVSLVNSERLEETSFASCKRQIIDIFFSIEENQLQSGLLY